METLNAPETAKSALDLATIYRAIQDGSDLEQLSGINWGVNEWGSCQYTGDLQLYKLLLQYGDELMHKLAHVESTPVNMHAIRGQFMSNEVKRLFEYYEDESELEELQQKLTELIQLPVTATPDTYFKYCRNYGTLWEAAPYMAKLVGFKINCKDGRSGYGSDETAIACYLLKSRKFVIDETSFADFDT